jgi:hypothetical protein
MTLAITPVSATNKLKIDVIFVGSTNATEITTIALFQDTTANALAAQMGYSAVGGTVENIKLTHYMTAGTTSSTTFKVRAGLSGAGTLTFNGRSAVRLFGGVMASSITITEIKA